MAMGVMVLGQLSFGPVADRWNARRAMAAACVLFSISILTLLGAKSYATAITFAALYGFTMVNFTSEGEFLQIGLPAMEAYSELYYLLVRNSVIIAVVILLITLASRFFVNQYVYKPVNSLTETARILADGDLSVRTSMDIPSGELKQLSTTFNLMAEQLEQRDFENKAIHDEVLRQKEYFETLVQNSPVAIVTLNNENRINQINPAFTELFGFTSEEAIGKPIDELVNSEETLFEAKSITSNVVDGKMEHFISRRQRKDGMLVDRKSVV